MRSPTECQRRRTGFNNLARAIVVSEFLNNPCFQRDISNANAKPWKLHDALKYRSTILGYTLTVPAGYRTDLASVPWFFRRFFPQDGPWTLAAVVHDYLCDKRFADIDNLKAAAIFREAMDVLHVPTWKLNIMYYAVRLFGPRWNQLTEAEGGN